MSVAFQSHIIGGIRLKLYRDKISGGFQALGHVGIKIAGCGERKRPAGAGGTCSAGWASGAGRTSGAGNSCWAGRACLADRSLRSLRPNHPLRSGRTGCAGRACGARRALNTSLPHGACRSRRPRWSLDSGRTSWSRRSRNRDDAAAARRTAGRPGHKALVVHGYNLPFQENVNRKRALSALVNFALTGGRFGCGIGGGREDAVPYQSFYG